MRGGRGREGLGSPVRIGRAMLRFRLMCLPPSLNLVPQLFPVPPSTSTSRMTGVGDGLVCFHLPWTLISGNEAVRRYVEAGDGRDLPHAATEVTA